MFKRSHPQSTRHLRYALGIILGLFWSTQAHADVIVGVNGGLSSMTGSDLSHESGVGGQLILGWGGRPGMMSKGSALYGYGAFSLDQIQQRGPQSLGKPLLSRQQWMLSVGLRAYQRRSAQNNRGKRSKSAAFPPHVSGGHHR